MARKLKSSDAKIKVEAVASANIGATYSVSKNITEVVPEDVTRAKAVSWLDLISPLTEWAGLKGDELRVKRDILRLQREETLSRIAARIKAKSEISLGTTVIPTKFIVNYLEKASLEDPDDELVGLWANLLLSAAEDYNPRQLHFVNIISQMSSRQAKIFEALIGTKNSNTLELGWDTIESYLQSSKIHEHIKQEIEKVVNLRELRDVKMRAALDKLSDKAGTWLNSVGVEFVYGDVGAYRDRKDMREILCDWSQYADEDQIDYEILVALGLIQRVDTGFMLIDRWFEFTFKYYHITPLGVGFARACKIVESEHRS